MVTTLLDCPSKIRRGIEPSAGTRTSTPSNAVTHGLLRPARAGVRSGEKREQIKGKLLRAEDRGRARRWPAALCARAVQQIVLIMKYSLVTLIYPCARGRQRVTAAMCFHKTAVPSKGAIVRAASERAPASARRRRSDVSIMEIDKTEGGGKELYPSGVYGSPRNLKNLEIENKKKDVVRGEGASIVSHVVFGRRRRRTSLTYIVNQISVTTFELDKAAINSDMRWSFGMKNADVSLRTEHVPFLPEMKYPATIYSFRMRGLGTNEVNKVRTRRRRARHLAGNWADCGILYLFLKKSFVQIGIMTAVVWNYKAGKRATSRIRPGSETDNGSGVEVGNKNTCIWKAQASARGSARSASPLRARAFAQIHLYYSFEMT
ncbi:hypothetical protein EVAR_18141_1 [Eumeta japonica]|uniref:Uncharacterized protein n=1 Tax=Eumeta variegata TaxID=151549 RepID=A0A4C1UWH6_EUMVA|nr:hypothetical protein EVAR_18141_1 [Eumeta japonica]